MVLPNSKIGYLLRAKLSANGFYRFHHTSLKVKRLQFQNFACVAYRFPHQQDAAAAVAQVGIIAGDVVVAALRIPDQVRCGMDAPLSVFGKEKPASVVPGECVVVPLKLLEGVRWAQPLPLEAQAIDGVEFLCAALGGYCELSTRFFDVAPHVAVDIFVNLIQVAHIQAVSVARGLAKASPVKRQPVGKIRMKRLMKGVNFRQLCDELFNKLMLL